MRVLKGFFKNLIILLFLVFIGAGSFYGVKGILNLRKNILENQNLLNEIRDKRKMAVMDELRKKLKNKNKNINKPVEWIYVWNRGYKGLMIQPAVMEYERLFFNSDFGEIIEVVFDYDKGQGSVVNYGKGQIKSVGTDAGNSKNELIFVDDKGNEKPLQNVLGVLKKYWSKRTRVYY